VGTVGGRIAGAKIPFSLSFLDIFNASVGVSKPKQIIGDSEGNIFNPVNCCFNKLTLFHNF
jgi:hypothetical protein